MTLQAYQHRVVDERHDLEWRLGNLRAFLNTEQCMSLSFEDRSLLVYQEKVMTELSEILARRIERFFSAEEDSRVA